MEVGNTEIIEILQEYGNDVIRYNAMGQTPYDIQQFAQVTEKENSINDSFYLFSLMEEISL
jgi:hypothetical protein